MGDWVTSQIYPFRQVYDTGYKPEGADKAVKTMLNQAFPQLAVILQSGAGALGVGPEQISPFLGYSRPTTPGYNEAKYAVGLSARHSVMLSGDTADVAKQAFRTSAKEALQDVGKDVVVDILTQALPNVPGVPMAGLIQVGMQVFENKDLLKTAEGRKQLAKQAGFTVAAFIPGVNIIAAPAALALGVSDMVKAKNHMKAEVERSKDMMKMIDNNLEAALDEARGLSTDLAERGISLKTTPDPAWADQLRKHYEELVLVIIDDRNRQRDLEKTAWYAKGAGYVAAHWEERSKFDHEPRELGRKDNIRIFLQFARDMHKVREALKGTLAPVGSATKSPTEVAAEIQRVAAAMLAKDPLMPIQEAINLASAMARGAPQPIAQADAPAAAAYVQAKATQVKASSALALGGGAVALMLGIKFLPMLMKGRN